MFLGANWLLRRLRGKCREKGNAAALRLFISQHFLKTPVLSLAAPPPQLTLTVIRALPSPQLIHHLHTWMPCCCDSWGLAQAAPYPLRSQTAKWGPYRHTSAAEARVITVPPKMRLDAGNFSVSLSAERNLLPA